MQTNMWRIKETLGFSKVWKARQFTGLCHTASEITLAAISFLFSDATIFPVISYAHLFFLAVVAVFSIFSYKNIDG